MNSARDNFESIEQFLNGKLDGQELSNFENRILVDEELYKDVEIHKLANELVIENRLLDVKSICEEEVRKDARRYKQGKMFWGLAIVGALSGGYWFLNSNSGIKESNSISTSQEVEVENMVAENKSTAQAPVSKKNYSRNDVIASKNSSSDDNENEISDLEITSASTGDNISAIVDKTPALEPSVQADVKVDICSGTKISASAIGSEICLGEKTGSVSVSAIKGGKAPYKIQLLENLNEVANFQLTAGLYNVIISDANNCQSELRNIEVKEKKCSQHFVFNPFIGEVWAIPEVDKSAVLTIFDKSGKEYYKKDLTANTTESWAGESGNGDVNSGYFIFIIKYADESFIEGSITIVR